MDKNQIVLARVTGVPGARRVFVATRPLEGRQVINLHHMNMVHSGSDVLSFLRGVVGGGGGDNRS